MAGSAGALQVILAQLGRLKVSSEATLFVLYHRLANKGFVLQEFAVGCLPWVQAASDGARVHANFVYHPRDDQDLEVRGGRLVVSRPARRHHPNIDLLLESLAKDYGPRVLAVLLSGLAADGLRGLQAVRAAGGRIVVQSPASSKFPQLPEAAIAAGLGDTVADLPELHRLVEAALAGTPMAAL